MISSDAPGKPSIQLLSRKLACENSKFQVYFDTVKDAMGSIVQDYLVVAPRVKRPDNVAGTAILPILSGKIGLIKMFRYPVCQESIEVPRGFMDENESIEQSAARELFEETGLICDLKDLQMVADVTPEAGIICGKIRVYIAKECRVGEHFRPSELGIQSFQFYTLEEVDALVRKGSICDPSTILALYHYSKQVQQ